MKHFTNPDGDRASVWISPFTKIMGPVAKFPLVQMAPLLENLVHQLQFSRRQLIVAGTLGKAHLISHLGQMFSPECWLIQAFDVVHQIQHRANDGAVRH